MTFPWTCEERETCYLPEGEVIVTAVLPAQPVRFAKGDLVTFPAGMSCIREIWAAVRKRYRFALLPYPPPSRRSSSP